MEWNGMECNGMVRYGMHACMHERKDVCMYV